MFLHWVAGLSLHDKVRTWTSQEGLRIKLFHFHRNRSQNEKWFITLVGVPWMPPVGNHPGTAHLRFLAKMSGCSASTVALWHCWNIKDHLVKKNKQKKNKVKTFYMVTYANTLQYMSRYTSSVPGVGQSDETDAIKTCCSDIFGSLI